MYTWNITNNNINTIIQVQALIFEAATCQVQRCVETQANLVITLSLWLAYNTCMTIIRKLINY